MLRSLPIFHHLPLPALEGMAHALERVEYDPGAVIIREGEQGDRFYAIAQGDVEIRQGDVTIGVVGRGASVGEIALLQEGLRTATAVALTPVSAFTLGRVPFLTAVNGHAPTRQGAEAIVGEVRERDSHRRIDGDEGDPE